MSGAVISLAVALASAIVAVVYFAKKLVNESKDLAIEREVRAATQRAREFAEKELRRLATENHTLAVENRGRVSRLSMALREAHDLTLQNADAATVRKMIQNALKGDKS